MKKLLFVMLAMIMLSAEVSAAKIDMYREILLSHKYTIRYDNITPAPRVTNKDKMELYGKSGLSVSSNDIFLNRPVSGIITSDGDDRYEQVGNEDFYQCRLIKNDETFIFTKYKSKKSTGYEYYGNKRGKVEANQRNYLAEMISGESFGDENFSRLLNAMLNNDEKSADMLQYEFIAEGELDNGLSYEDYGAKSENDELNAIRYYFEDDKLIKIAYASYGLNKHGNAEGTKFIVRIREFTNAADSNLLKLPAELVDVTKR